METNVEVKYFMVNDCWFYGGESKEECLASTQEC